MLGFVLKRFGIMRPVPWVQRLMAAMLFLIGIISAWKGQYVLAFLLGGLVIYGEKVNELREALKHQLTKVWIAAICAVAALVLSFLIGLQRAEAVLNSQTASEMSSIDDKSLPARLIRGGDKGILFFSLDAKKVRFLRWDSIKEIDTL